MIAFLPVPETGHFLATLGLARGLVARGHAVEFLTIPDFEPTVRAEGFACRPIFAAQFPRGFLARAAAVTAGGRPRAVWREIHAILAAARSCLDLALARGPRALVAEGPLPDLVVVDALAAPAALPFRGADIPTIVLSTLLPMERAPLVPPLTSGIVPRDTLACRLAIALAWQARFLRQGFIRVLFADDVVFTRRLADAAGYPLSAIETATSFMCPALTLPEIVLCPRAFDFPRPLPPHRHHAGPGIDPARREPPFDWSRLAPDRPLVYVSLGTQGHLFPGRRRLLQALVETLEARPHCQAVVATGDVEALPARGNRVMVVPAAPQLRLLERADLMVTHGGLSSVKECLYHGVPMVVLPLVRDQPGNAARVAYHGLGVVGDPRRPSVAALHALLDTVEGTPSIRPAAAAMATEFRRAEATDDAVTLLERLRPR